jgi:hypothetical protein
MGRRAQRKRSSRAAAALEALRLHGEREQLARVVEGGTPARPIDVESPVEVDAIAAATPCPICDRSQTLLSHDAVVIDGERLRLARVACVWCRKERSIYFRLRPAPLH